MLDPYLAEWLGLVLRWFHFMIGIAWIGASFYFVWLNNSIRAPGPGGREGLAGELWAVHGGAFYEIAKYAGAPATLPDKLHWFKWEAYLTWLTGMALLILLWWTQAGTKMVDPAVADISPMLAVGIGAACIFGGWLVYDGLCRTPLRQRSALLGLILLVLLGGTAWGLSQVFSPRAAYLHVGAMMGTWMAANVFFVIIPGQRAMVDAMIAGQPPPVERGQAGALRSLHNNYLTMPVLFVMISSHFPNTWGHPRGWAILVGLGLCGAAWRHWVNREEQGRPQHWVLGALVAGLVLIAVLSRPAPAPAAADGAEAVSFTKVQQLISIHCLACHAAEPIQPGFVVAPKGVAFDHPQDIRDNAATIYQQVVQAKIMPLGNMTGMTDEERALIGQWAVQEGAAE